jgi:hypothetical protein
MIGMLILTDGKYDNLETCLNCVLFLFKFFVYLGLVSRLPNMLPVSLGCQFLIASSVFFNVYWK